jgi:hypothetical protein
MKRKTQVYSESNDPTIFFSNKLVPNFKIMKRKTQVYNESNDPTIFFSKQISAKFQPLLG